MNLKKIFLILVILLFSITAWSAVKEADLAGSWYPKSKDSLSGLLENLLLKANPRPINNEIIAFIAPHAGFTYSGPVAAYVYKAIQKAPNTPSTVIIIGFNHRFRHAGIALCNFDSYKTPIGQSSIDLNIVDELTKQNENIYILNEAFFDENSTEIQIPFIQKVLPDSKLVLIHIGNQTLKNCEILSQALYEVLKSKKDFLIIASTDMSHYLSYAKAVETDNYTISEIKKLDPYAFYEKSQKRNHSLMCGQGAVIATMLVCKKLGADSLEILKYANSGDVTLDKTKVVGYLAAAIFKNNTRNPKPDPSTNSGSALSKVEWAETRKNNKENKMELSAEDKKTLIHIARKTLREYLSSKKIPEFEVSSSILKENMGAFVTLKRQDALRGCIGNIVGQKPLYLTVRNMAIEAATGDPRFPKVKYEELKDLDIEISVLSPLERVNSADEIIMGKHGVIVKRGFQQGVYLPQVAMETGWSKEEFLSSLCSHKAGLSPSAWKEKETELYVFTATVFSEKDIQ
ncbi:MAG: AmmeMemoRadiSam system protein B [Candidatus Omnitrophica bacterium]|nr:AmmeMemoRadiSam system protein B [Candidatus Omnitrophota bacterium]